MARGPVKKQVYPPRYFAGFVELEPWGGAAPVRVDFRNAPLVPLDETCGLLFPGTRDSAFYSAAEHAANFPGGWLTRVQYAISVYDDRSGSYFVERFNHPFRPRTTTIKRVGDVVRISASRLFLVQRVDETLTGLEGSAVPVVQFCS